MTEMTDEWQGNDIESAAPCGSLWQGKGLCKGILFRALPGRDGRPPVFRCRRCGVIRFRIVPYKKEGEGEE